MPEAYRYTLTLRRDVIDERGNVSEYREPVNAVYEFLNEPEKCNEALIYDVLIKDLVKMLWIEHVRYTWNTCPATNKLKEEQ